MPAKTTRPPLQIYVSAFSDEVERDNKPILDLKGVTKNEHKQIEVTLLALNELDLTEPRARKALMAILRTSPTWCATRPDEQLEALSR